MSVLSDLETEIQRAQQTLNEMQARRAVLLDTLAYLETQRPAGIPSTWKPHFTGRRPNPIVISAWFDPTKFGDDLQRR